MFVVILNYHMCQVVVVGIAADLGADYGDQQRRRPDGGPVSIESPGFHQPNRDVAALTDAPTRLLETSWPSSRRPIQVNLAERRIRARERTRTCVRRLKLVALVLEPLALAATDQSAQRLAAYLWLPSLQQGALAIEHYCSIITAHISRPPSDAGESPAAGWFLREPRALLCSALLNLSARRPAANCTALVSSGLGFERVKLSQRLLGRPGNASLCERDAGSWMLRSSETCIDTVASSSYFCFSCCLIAANARPTFPT